MFRIATIFVTLMCMAGCGALEDKVQSSCEGYATAAQVDAMTTAMDTFKDEGMPKIDAIGIVVETCQNETPYKQAECNSCLMAILEEVW